MAITTGAYVHEFRKGIPTVELTNAINCWQGYAVGLGLLIAHVHHTGLLTFGKVIVPFAAMVYADQVAQDYIREPHGAEASRAMQALYNTFDGKNVFARSSRRMGNFHASTPGAYLDGWEHRMQTIKTEMGKIEAAWELKAETPAAPEATWVRSSSADGHSHGKASTPAADSSETLQPPAAPQLPSIKEAAQEWDALCASAADVDEEADHCSNTSADSQGTRRTPQQLDGLTPSASALAAVGAPGSDARLYGEPGENYMEQSTKSLELKYGALASQMQKMEAQKSAVEEIRAPIRAQKLKAKGIRAVVAGSVFTALIAIQNLSFHNVVQIPGAAACPKIAGMIAFPLWVWTVVSWSSPPASDPESVFGFVNRGNPTGLANQGADIPSDPLLPWGKPAAPAQVAQAAMEQPFGNSVMITRHSTPATRTNPAPVGPHTPHGNNSGWIW